MECPGLHHPGQNKKQRPKQTDNKMRRKESRRPGLQHPGRKKQQGPPPPNWSIWGQVAARRPRRVHPGRNKEQELPPPGLDHSGTSGGRLPRTASSGADQAAQAAAPRTGSSGDKGWPDAPDWNIRAGAGSRSQRTHNTKVDGHVAGRRPGLEHPGQNKRERPQALGLGKDGLPPRKD